MDRRQQKTRRAIFDAFTFLLEKKPYAKISVQEIIDAANVGRSTFYAHFETKDELLGALCTEIFEHVFEEHPAEEKTHDFSGRKKDLRGEVTHILYHLNDARPYLRGILSGESGETFMRYLKDALSGLFAPELRKRASDVPEAYLLNHTVSDFAETVRWWMKNESYSAEDVSRFFFSVSPFA